MSVDSPELIAMTKAFYDADAEAGGYVHRWDDLLPSIQRRETIFMRTALRAIREIDDGPNDDGPLAKSIAVIEDYYDPRWSVSAASDAWTAAIDHILGETP